MNDSLREEVNRLREENRRLHNLVMLYMIKPRLHDTEDTPEEQIVELKRQIFLQNEKIRHILNTREQLAGIQPRRNHAETVLQTDAGE